MKKVKRTRRRSPRHFMTEGMYSAGYDASRDAAYAEISRMCEDRELSRELDLACIRIFEILIRILGEEVGEPAPEGQ